MKIARISIGVLLILWNSYEALRLIYLGYQYTLPHLDFHFRIPYPVLALRIMVDFVGIFIGIQFIRGKYHLAKGLAVYFILLAIAILIEWITLR